MLACFTVLIAITTYLLEYRWDDVNRPANASYYLQLGYLLYCVMLIDLIYQLTLLRKEIPVVSISQFQFIIRRYIFGQSTLDASQIEKVLLPKKHNEDALVVVLKKTPSVATAEKLVFDVELPDGIEHALLANGIIFQYVPSVKARYIFPAQKKA